MTFDCNVALARSFLDAFNERDLERFLATLAPAVELHTPGGVFRGRAGAARWFERPLEHLTMRLEPVVVSAGETWVIVVAKVVLCWKVDGGLADESQSVEFFQIGPDGVERWQPFEDVRGALSAAGFAAP